MSMTRKHAETSYLQREVRSTVPTYRNSTSHLCAIRFALAGPISQLQHVFDAHPVGTTSAPSVCIMTTTESKQLKAFIDNLESMMPALERDYPQHFEGSAYCTAGRLAMAVLFERAPIELRSDARIVAAQGDAIRAHW